jgi:hypothetical protein
MKFYNRYHKLQLKAILRLPQADLTSSFLNLDPDKEVKIDQNKNITLSTSEFGLDHFSLCLKTKINMESN